MKKKDNTAARITDISFCGLLCIAFIVLKLCGVISWSWWWITAPLWIPVALGVLTAIVILFVITIKETRDDYKKHR